MQYLILSSSNISFFRILIFAIHFKSNSYTMFKNLYLELTFIKRCKKFKAHAMKKRTHLRAIFQRVLTMKPISVNGVPVLLFLKSLLVFYSSVTSRFKLAIVLYPLNKETKTLSKMIALLNGPRINRLGMMTNKVHSATRPSLFRLLLDHLTTTMSKQKIIYYIHQFLKASESFSLQKISMVFKRVSESKTLTSSFRILATIMFIFAYFYFFYVNSLDLVIMFISVSNKKVDLQLASQLLDDVEVDNFFLLALERKFGKTLGIYLTKYLIFWLRVENPFGRYFLDSSFDPENRSVAFWGSPFNHKEILQMNDLPKDRKKVAIINFLGKKIKFQKINHLFGFFSLLQNAVRQNLLRSEPALDYNIKTLKSFFSFTNFPTYPVELIQYPRESGQEVGLLHIDFENTFNFSDFISKDKGTTKQKVLEDFLFFLEILDIKIDYDGENLLRFIKNLEDIRLELILENQTVDIFRQAENNQNINYIDQFLDIFNRQTSLKIKKNMLFSKLRQAYFIPKVLTFFKKLLVKKLVFFFRILITLLIFYSYFYDCSQEFFLFFSLGLTTKPEKNFSLQSKNLILDNVIPFSYFEQQLKKIYGIELGSYLSKYLTYWIQQPNSFGSHFLSSDYDDGCDHTLGEIENLNYFGSPFNNQDLLNMNNLPVNRNNVAKITLFNQDIFFDKITDFFYLLSGIFSKSSLKFDVEFVDELLFYKFPLLPSLRLRRIWVGHNETKKIGFFLVDFSHLNSLTKIHNSSEIENLSFQFLQNPLSPKVQLEQFLHFLKITDLKITLPEHKKLSFLKTLEGLKFAILKNSLVLNKDLIEEKDTFKNNAKRDFRMLKYLDQMINICKKNLITFDKILWFNFFCQTGIGFLKKSLLLTFSQKVNLFRKKKLLVLTCIICFFILRLFFTNWLFLLFAVLSLFSIINEKEKRNFPNFQSLLFDFRQNALSRLSLRKFFPYLIFLRFFLLSPKFSDFLNFKETILNNEFSFYKNNLFDYMFKRCSNIQEKTERYLAIYLATQPDASKAAWKVGLL